MTGVHFQVLGEAAEFTAPGEGQPTVPTRAIIDEANGESVPGAPRHAMRDRKVMLWLPRVADPAGAWQGLAVSPAKSSRVVVTLGGGAKRFFEVDSLQHTDPDRFRVAAKELVA